MKRFPSRLLNGRFSLLLVALLCAALPADAQESSADNLGSLVELLAAVEEPAFQLDVLKGLREGIRGRRNVTPPTAWQATYAKLAKSPNAEVRDLALLLALDFGDPAAVATLRARLTDPKTEIAGKRGALVALVERRVPGLAPTLHALLQQPALRSDALRLLAAYDDPQTPAALLAIYARLPDEEKQHAVQTLSARPQYALALLDAVEQGTIPRADISAFTARQLASYGDKQILARLEEVWGAVRAASADRKAAIERYKGLLTVEALAKAEAPRGREIYTKVCGQCHRLYGEGGKVGPDLTGSNRANLDYVLENVLDPSAAIAKDYRMHVIVTADGRLLTGIVAEDNERTLVLQTVNERLVLAKEEIEERRASPVSMMPDGQFDKMPLRDVLDLVRYLASKDQVALPASDR